MASTYSALKVELLETGANSGTWGTLTNVNLGNDILGEAITGSATVDFATDADVTITLTDSSTSQSARNLRLNITESSTGVGSVRNLILGSGCQIEKFYLINNTGTGAKTVKNTSGTGISVPAGKATLVYNNGTNVVDAASYFTSLTLGSALPVASGGTGTTSTTFANLTTNVTGTLPIANGGTGTTSTTFVNAATNITGLVPIANGGTATATPALVQGTGVTITGTWPNQTINATGTGGTVTSASVVTANGFAGTVATATTTPAITLTTSITGVLKGNGTALSAATAGTDYVAPGTATTFTATQTFAGTSSVLAEILTNVAEIATVSATAATGTINYDVTTQSVLYFTTNASANWTVNFRASSGTSLNTAMSTGQSVTAAFLVTQGSTAYYNSTVQVDGSSVTPKFQGGTAYTAGNASSIDVYVYTIIKTGNAAFTVFASQTKFA